MAYVLMLFIITSNPSTGDRRVETTMREFSSDTACLVAHSNALKLLSKSNLQFSVEGSCTPA